MKTITAILIIFSLALSSCYMGRVFFVNVPSVKDHRFFADHKISPGDPNFNFIYPDEKTCNKLVPDSFWYQSSKYGMNTFFEDHKTSAFIIIRNDSVLYEKYFNNYDHDSYVTTFSMVKSFVSALMGIAIEERAVGSVNDAITRYIPELGEIDSTFHCITIEDVLNMESGIGMNENYMNPFSDLGKAYFGSNLEKIIKKLYIDVENPRGFFRYMNYNTQILGIIIMRATGKNLSQYLEEKIWKPLGMEYSAKWSVDSKRHGMEKAYCCLNGRARDFARFGRLFLRKGNWEGKQIVPEKWASICFDEAKGKMVNYRYQWWLMNRKSNDFMAAGILGQYIYVYPDKNLIIVRFGKSKGKVVWEDVFEALAEEL